MDKDDEADTDDEDDGTVISQSLVDPASFSVLFDRYFEEIHRYLARRVLSEDAEDLAAECFVVAFRSRNTFDLAKRTARPWIYGIATNLLRNSQRKELHRLMMTDRIIAERPELVSLSVDQIAIGHADLQQLAVQMSELPLTQRDALVLVSVVGLTYDETAEALGIPVGTVRSRVANARARLIRERSLVQLSEDGEPK